MLNNLLEVQKQKVFRISKVVDGKTITYSGIFRTSLDAGLDATKNATASAPIQKLSIVKLN